MAENDQQQNQKQQEQNSQQNNSQGNQQQQQQQQTPPPSQTWEQVLEKLPKEQKELYEAHTKGLKNTVEATREERDGLKGQLQEALKKAEKGSVLETTLTETLKKLEVMDKRAKFAEQAIKPEIGCKNPKAAFLVAQEGEHFKKNGDPDWEAIKKEAPELFGPIIPEGDGGKGTGDKPAKPGGKNQRINDGIRTAAGVRT
jgi:hypothetical protein